MFNKILKFNFIDFQISTGFMSENALFEPGIAVAHAGLHVNLVNLYTGP